MAPKILAGDMPLKERTIPFETLPRQKQTRTTSEPQTRTKEVIIITGHCQLVVGKEESHETLFGTAFEDATPPQIISLKYLFFVCNIFNVSQDQRNGSLIRDSQVCHRSFFLLIIKTFIFLKKKQPQEQLSPNISTLSHIST